MYSVTSYFYQLHSRDVNETLIFLNPWKQMSRIPRMDSG